MNKITSQQLLDAFREEWEHRVEQNWEQIDIDWAASRRKGQNGAPWTHFMLDKGGFLDSMRKRLSRFVTPLDYYPEMYKIDVAFAGGVDLFRDDLCYPSVLHVLIEHELDKRVEEEVWKLIFWRSPLKVLIFYDHDDHKKKRKPTKEWLENKIPVLREMIRKAEDDSGRSDSSTYLFIVGCRKSEDGEIYWRWTSDEEEQELTTFIGE